MKNQRPIAHWSWRGAALALFSLLLAVTGPAALVQPADASVKQQPPGANSFVQIDGTPVDSTPGNQPHVGCRFAVKFFGFDEGTNTADVTFQAQPPSGQFTPVLPTEGRTVFTFQGQTPPGNTLNHTEFYQLNTTALETNQKDEVHVMIDVMVRDDSGNEVFHKFKVFWTKQCAPLVDGDGDGVPDADGDGIPDAEDRDADGDGIPDDEEDGLDGFDAGIEKPASDQGAADGSTTAEGTGSTETNATAMAFGWIALLGTTVLAGVGLRRFLRRRGANDTKVS